MEALTRVQSILNAPKGQFNSFGKYKYRSCEDILAALKKPLADNQCHLTITDEIVLVGDRYYIKATVCIADEKTSVSVSAFAREAVSKKGMDEAQITGAASSYARKYALSGLFAIDDTKDADADERPQSTNTSLSEAQVEQIKKGVNDTNSDVDKFLAYLGADTFENIPGNKFKMALQAISDKKAQIKKAKLEKAA